jgi:hypothetical protein
MLALVSMFPVNTLERRRDSSFMHLEIDLRHPADVLIAMVEDELREAIGDDGRQRRRLDKVDFYLSVSTTSPSVGNRLPRSPVVGSSGSPRCGVPTAAGASKYLRSRTSPEPRRTAAVGYRLGHVRLRKAQANLPPMQDRGRTGRILPAGARVREPGFPRQRERTGHDTVRG